jgi:hypothetical protein
MGDRRKTTCQPNVVILIHQNQAKEFHTMALKWEMTKG